MEIDQLRIFEAVVRAGSMSRAAEETFITQSAVSQSIARLEEELGVKLFVRTGRGIRLREAGERFHVRVASALGELEEACREAREQAGIEEGTLRLMILAGSALMPQLLGDFSRMYPDVRYQIVQQNTQDEFDLCVNYAPDGVPPENGDILLTEEVMLVVPDTHPLASRRSIQLSEARDENFIMMRKGSALRNLANDVCKRAGFEPKVVFESDSPATVRSLMRLGLGAAFLPFVSWHEILDEHIRPLHIEYPSCFRTLCIFAPRGQAQTGSARAFQAFAVRYFDAFNRRVLVGV